MALIAARTATGAAEASNAAADASVATRVVWPCTTAASPGMELLLITIVSKSCNFLRTFRSPEISRYLVYYNCSGVKDSIMCCIGLRSWIISVVIFSVGNRSTSLPMYNSMVTTRWAASNTPCVNTARSEAATAAAHARAARATPGALAPETAVVYHHFELIQTKYSRVANKSDRHCKILPFFKNCFKI